jgi:hypothetical protein
MKMSYFSAVQAEKLNFRFGWRRQIGLINYWQRLSDEFMGGLHTPVIGEVPADVWGCAERDSYLK